MERKKKTRKVRKTRKNRNSRLMKFFAKVGEKFANIFSKVKDYSTIVFGFLIAVIALVMFYRTFISMYESYRDISYNQQRKRYYLNQIREDSIVIHQIRTNDIYLEKFAREKYNMFSPGDIVYYYENGKE